MLGEDIVLGFTYSEQTLVVRADAGMIEQVLLNLAVNARDAMPVGGRLSIDTSVVEALGPESSAGGQSRTWACVRVSDNGAGIAPEHLPHIFEPFFTTKDVGKGTGLGLATTYGIVQQHGGWIEVTARWRAARNSGCSSRESRSGPRLPVPESRPAPSPRGRETVLVVEDEDSVRALVIRLPAGSGLPGSSGAERASRARGVAGAG